MSHPLVESISVFLQAAKPYVKGEEFTELLYALVLSNLANSYGATAEQETAKTAVGKAVMQIQFPSADDQVLLQAWRLATASADERRQSAGTIVAIVMKCSQQARKEAADAAKKAKLADEKKLAEDEQKSNLLRVLNSPISDLSIPQYLLEALQNNGIKYIGDLVSRTKAEVRRFQGVGDSSIKKIEAALDELDVCALGQDLGGWTRPGA